ncbi:hypothetical protein LEL_03164 [Akanthomyces lecanii RCEF 1005]|uniref:Uncharacterized protein n=1 Tax=Akanthomyces lecanii RCEF 1005 TaxID=1081108 RepID=A0A162KTN1_CORDF|nr:hypothetical protein LEL_03164 [Akanthomyces lecanii RCEF 1005]
MAAAPITTTNIGAMPFMNMSGLCSLAIFDSAALDFNFSPPTTTVMLQRDQIATVADQGGSSGRTCLPRAYWSAAIANQNPVFSPATACPDGYAPACTSVAPGVVLSAAVTVQVWPPLASGDIAIGCCPRVARGYGCVSTFERGHTTVVPDPYKGGNITSFQADASTTVIVSAIKVVYVPERQASSPAPSRSPSPSPSPTPTPAQSKPAAGLSTGQKAAIGVCAPVGVIGLVLALLFLHRRRRLRTASDKAGAEAAADASRRPELDGSGGKHEAPNEPSRVAGGESASASPVELPGPEKDIPACREIAELPASDADVSPSAPNPQPQTIRRKPIN